MRYGCRSRRSRRRNRTREARRLLRQAGRPTPKVEQASSSPCLPQPPPQRRQHKHNRRDRQPQHDVAALDDVADDLLDAFAVVEVGEGLVGQRDAEEGAERSLAVADVEHQELLRRHGRLHLLRCRHCSAPLPWRGRPSRRPVCGPRSSGAQQFSTLSGKNVFAFAPGPRGMAFWLFQQAREPDNRSARLT